MECKLLSHPGKLLKDHLLGSHGTGMDLFCRNILFKEYEDYISAILLLHDLGKGSVFFQSYIKKEKEVHEKLKRHAEISALWFYFYSLEVLGMGDKEAVLGYFIIKYHHGDFNNFNEMCIASLDAEDLFTINDNIDYEELRYICNKHIKADILNPENFRIFFDKYTRNGSIKSFRKIKRDLTTDDYILLNYFFSILLTADKCDAITNRGLDAISRNWGRASVDEYKKQFSTKRNVLNDIRNASYDEVESNINSESRFFSINLPTGSGKTLTVLNAALKLKDKTGCQRIIYCLPFTSVIDQNAEVFEDVLKYNNTPVTSETLLKHHHLTELEYIVQRNDEDKIYSAKDSEFLIEGWESEMIVTTFHQFLHTLLSNKNKSLRKFHSFANSIVILDEVQAIPGKYWRLINNILKLSADLLNIHFILVTATMPLIFSEEKKEIVELAVSKSSYYEALSRIKLHTEYIKETIHINDFKDILLREIEQNPDKSRLIIMNTIKSSLDVFSFLKERTDPGKIIYLSSNIIPKDRLKKILDIKENPKGRIVVSTQLIEAGVDIDMDVVYRDLSPLDSIFQACGRCNRNNSEGVSEVKLFYLKGDDKPFSAYVYDDVLIDSTKRVLSKKESFEEKEFLELSQQYYKEVEKFSINESDSDSISKNISDLLLNSAFNYNQDNKNAFKLIESFPVISAFIETDEQAKEALNKYNSIKETEYDDPFQKRIELKSVYRMMAPYIINIPERCANENGYDETLGKIWFITDVIKDYHYDPETGFKRDAKIVDYIF